MASVSNTSAYDTVLVVHLPKTQSQLSSISLAPISRIANDTKTTGRLGGDDGGGLLIVIKSPLLEYTKGKEKESETGEEVLVPTHSFEHVEGLVSKIYSAVARVFYSRGDHLGRVDVVIEGLRKRGGSNRDRASTEDVLGAGSRRKLELSSEDLRCDSQVVDGDVEVVQANTGGNEGDEDRPLEPVVALGGTFDHLHPGHKILLTMAAWIAEREVIVGITDEALLVKKSNRHLLESLQDRTSAVSSFLQLIAPHLTLSLPPLKDVFGPTATRPDITSLVVSHETVSGAEAIDKERKKNGLKGLKVWIIGVVDGKGNDGMEKIEEGAKGWTGKMGSTSIREALAKLESGGS